MLKKMGINAKGIWNLFLTLKLVKIPIKKRTPEAIKLAWAEKHIFAPS